MSQSVKNEESDKVENTKNSESNYTLKKLFSFEGRINRKTFWITSFYLIIICIPIMHDATTHGIEKIVIVLFYIPVVWIMLATYVKRWHDLGKSGWLALTLFIPFINLVIVLYLGFTPGTSESNIHGEIPS